VERIFVKIKENSFYRSNAYQNKMVRGVTIEFINNKHGSGIQGWWWIGRRLKIRMSEACGVAFDDGIGNGVI
jgi:hypothetical protein